MVGDEANPSTETERWYEAPPAGTDSLGPSHVSALDLVRSHTIGTLELIGVPGVSDTSASIGSTWQSVETQYFSSPLLIVKTWAFVPAFSTHTFLPGGRAQRRLIP